MSLRIILTMPRYVYDAAVRKYAEYADIFHLHRIYFNSAARSTRQTFVIFQTVVAFERHCDTVEVFRKLTIHSRRIQSP